MASTQQPHHPDDIVVWPDGTWATLGDVWADLPPSIELLSASGAHLRSAPPNVGSIFNGSAHPSTGRPFVCMRGSREFHTHSSHLGERWDSYRGKAGMDLLSILEQLWRGWKRAVG